MTRRWLTHPQTGGHFHCPDDAVDAWRDMGWQPAEAPPGPPSPAVAENLAWRAAQTRHEPRPDKPRRPAAATDKKE